MAGSGDEIAAWTAGCGQVRASQADREQVIEVLKTAFVEDRLTKDEFDLRVDQAPCNRSSSPLFPFDLTCVILENTRRSIGTTTASSSTPNGRSTSSPTAPSGGPPQPAAPTTQNPPATRSEAGCSRRCGTRGNGHMAVPRRGGGHGPTIGAATTAVPGGIRPGWDPAGPGRSGPCPRCRPRRRAPCPRGRRRPAARGRRARRTPR